MASPRLCQHPFGEFFLFFFFPPHSRRAGRRQSKFTYEPGRQQGNASATFQWLDGLIKINLGFRLGCIGPNFRNTIVLAHASVHDYILSQDFTDDFTQGRRVSSATSNTLLGKSCVHYRLHFADLVHPLNANTLPDAHVKSQRDTGSVRNPEREQPKPTIGPIEHIFASVSSSFLPLLWEPVGPNYRSREKSKLSICAGGEAESTQFWPDTAKSNIFNNYEGIGKIAENRTRGQKSGTDHAEEGGDRKAASSGTSLVLGGPDKGNILGTPKSRAEERRRSADWGGGLGDDGGKQEDAEQTDSDRFPTFLFHAHVVSRSSVKHQNSTV
ncbi:hypothetical protein DFH09DRAFT_1086659 [Mycena vulgaris]|nr:hypothetical protein DFH09DRAFT_1086659 [Mycena vulgaris]